MSCILIPMIKIWRWSSHLFRSNGTFCVFGFGTLVANQESDWTETWSVSYSDVFMWKMLVMHEIFHKHMFRDEWVNYDVLTQFSSAFTSNVNNFLISSNIYHHLLWCPCQFVLKALHLRGQFCLITTSKLHELTYISIKSMEIRPWSFVLELVVQLLFPK
jgi:hypothetical protein